MAEDYIEYIDHQDFERGSFADLRRGAWPEYIGDLRTIAQRDDADVAYDRAITIYESAGDCEFVCGEQEHTRLAGYFRGIRRGLGEDIPRDAPGITFSEWVEYKRERLPKLLGRLEEQGEWPVQLRALVGDGVVLFDHSGASEERPRKLQVLRCRTGLDRSTDARPVQRRVRPVVGHGERVRSRRGARRKLTLAGP